MGHSRLILVGLGLALLVFAQPGSSHLARAGGSAADDARLTHGPVVGAVDASHARVFVRTDRRALVQLRYGAQPNLGDAVETTAVATGKVHDFTAIVPLANLSPSTSYYIDVLVDGSSQLTPPYPSFKTFPPAGSALPFRFVILTDSSVGALRPVKTFRHADDEQPAFVILGGDYPHGKYTDLAAKRGRFKRVYSPGTSPSIHDFVDKVLRRYPVAHMWDDHDYGVDNGDKTYPDKQMSLRVLQEFFPTYPLSPYGDWQRFSYAQADIFMLDARSQRDPAKLPNGPTKSMLDGDNLGAQGQLAWLEQGLLESTARWKFILSPVPFNPTTKSHDSWGAFPNERQALIDFVTSHQIKGVIISSGDLHGGGIDNGTHSFFPEMVVNGANGNGCLSGKPGEWSEGLYGTQNQFCNGYGVVDVLTNPDRVVLRVKDDEGRQRIRYLVSLESSPNKLEQAGR